MWNNCFCNHPCPIFCRRLRCCTNDVVNPILTGNFGFFNNTTTQTIGALERIPVSFVLGEGTSVLPSMTTPGAVTLAQGTYEISYFANVVLPESGTARIALELNGALISGSSVEESSPSGTLAALSQTIMLEVEQSSTLELVNGTSVPLVVNLASLSIKKL